MSELLAYLDQWSVRAGEAVQLHVHSDVATIVQVDVVDLGDAGDGELVAAGPAVAGIATQALAGRQHTRIGSYALLPLPGQASGSATLSLLVRAAPSYAGIVAALPGGAALRWSGDGHLELIDSGDTVLAAVLMAAATWTVVAVTEAPDGGELRAWPLGEPPGSATPCLVPPGLLAGGAGALWIAARPDALGVPRDHFNGSIEAPAVHAATLTAAELLALRGTPGAHIGGRGLMAAWDFSVEPTGDRLVDRGPLALHGKTSEGPTRLVPGAYWRPGLLDPDRDPARFAAIHFHSDDTLGAGWKPSATVALPATLPSGVYGMRVVSDATGARDVVPFWVRPAAGARSQALAYLAPTYTYLAYGNAPDAMLGPAYWGGGHRYERLRHHHPELGPSLYSRHPDKSGVTMVSRLRPVLTIRPGVRPWGFEADRLLTGWLRASGYGFDVLTDEDIDRDGLDALAPHRVVVTGNHPEYWSAGMLEALQRWLRDGGRLLYLGGNGFYWRISSCRDLPGVIECRRPEGGTRPWIAEPGESHHQLDGEPGGLWRRLGLPPQRVVGVGFAGQGFERSTAYKVVAEARDGWAGFALEGVTTDTIGTSGRLGGGAAGQEIDRYDRRLGSSPHAVVVGTSQGLHDAATLRTLEELLSHDLPIADPKVRSDLTITPMRGGGAVFAVGSMAFVGALDDPGISRLLRNVLDRFAHPAPVGPPGWQ